MNMLCSMAAVAFVGAAASLCSAQDPPREQREANELQKVDRVLTFLRNRNAHDYAVTAQGGIDEAMYVRSGGLEQWITIRGEDRRNPVLLFLHGGPGEAVNPWAYAGFRSWLKYFTVVQWDQPGAGRTLGRNGAASASSITIDQMVKDGVDLTELLEKRLGKEKIVLVGHSWGSILGVHGKSPPRTLLRIRGHRPGCRSGAKLLRCLRGAFRTGLA